MASKKMAIEYLSTIGQATFHLQRFTDAEIVDAMTFMRHVNPDLFAFLGRVIAAKYPADLAAPPSCA